jgi:hypothetical protein
LELKVFQGCSILTWYILPNQNRDPRRENHTLRSWCACVWTYVCGMGMYVVVDIWWNNDDTGCNMVRVKTWNLILLCSLRGYFSLLNFENFEEYLGSIFFFFLFFSFFRTRTQASFTYQEINNKDC